MATDNSSVSNPQDRPDYEAPPELLGSVTPSDKFASSFEPEMDPIDENIISPEDVEAILGCKNEEEAAKKLSEMWMRDLKEQILADTAEDGPDGYMLRIAQTLARDDNMGDLQHLIRLSKGVDELAKTMEDYVDIVDTGVLDERLTDEQAARVETARRYLGREKSSDDSASAIASA